MPFIENMHGTETAVGRAARLKIGKTDNICRAQLRSRLSSIAIDRKAIGSGRLADNQYDQFTPVVRDRDLRASVPTAVSVWLLSVDAA